MTVSVSLGRFNDQSHIAACEMRHIKFELRMAGRSGFGGELRGLCRTLDFRHNLGALEGILGLIVDDDLKKCAFAGKPGPGVKQLEV
jgi:hypothetical protein